MKLVKMICLLLLLAFSVLTAQELGETFRSAFELAQNREALQLDFERAREWAKNFVEQRADFSKKQSLVQQFQQARDFALAENGLRMSLEEAQQWAKNLVLQRGKISPRGDLARELNNFLETVPFAKEEQAKEWTQNFLASPFPIYSELSVLERFREIESFLQNNLLFSLAEQQAKEKARDFIQTRYYFAPSIPLVQQYVLAFEFAEDFQGLYLEFEKARQWAKEFVEKRGTLSPEQSLQEQFTENIRFALLSGGLSLEREEAEKWAEKFLIERGCFSPKQSLFAQFREAYIFAYNSDILPILEPTRPEIGNLQELNSVPRGKFLADEAREWAQVLLEKRAEISIEGSLVQKYFDARAFAYSREGLEMNLEDSKKWALDILQQEVK